MSELARGQFAAVSMDSLFSPLFFISPYIHLLLYLCLLPRNSMHQAQEGKKKKCHFNQHWYLPNHCLFLKADLSAVHSEAIKSCWKSHLSWGKGMTTRLPFISWFFFFFLPWWECVGVIEFLHCSLLWSIFGPHVEEKNSHISAKADLFVISVHPGWRVIVITTARWRKIQLEPVCVLPHFNWGTTFDGGFWIGSYKRGALHIQDTKGLNVIREGINTSVILVLPGFLIFPP